MSRVKNKSEAVSRLLTISEMVLAYSGGFRWVAYNEIGCTSLFKKKPRRRKEVTGDNRGYDSWVIEGNFPIKNFKEYSDTEHPRLGRLTWEDEPMKLIDYIREMDPMVAYVLKEQEELNCKHGI